jgi:uncharacterized protein
MKFAQDQINSRYLIESYEDGCIRVGNSEFTQNLLLMPDKLQEIWQLTNMDELSGKHLAELANYKPDVLLIGCGKTQHFPHPSIFVPLMKSGIGYEIMPTHAACRTYNILMAEDRRVLAALII